MCERWRDEYKFRGKGWGRQRKQVACVQVQSVMSSELSLKGQTEFQEAREVEGVVASKAGSQDESLLYRA